ncbi:MAG: DDHD family phospholipase [Candidatus Omnitrophica bacterium]|nr:DDHD family phospholipase [Candidatus Omnitrophota bacterium]
MNPINIAIVHGIGITKPGYAAPLIAGITREYRRAAHKQNAGQKEAAPELNFIEIVWDDIIAANQQTLAERLKAGLPPSANQSVWAKAVQPLLAPLKKGINWLRTDFAAEFVSDIIAYGNADVYAKIHERILTRINTAAPAKGKTNLTFVAHSLGSVITSDFIYDQIRRDGEFHPHFQFSNFFTMGSPLALFALRYGPEAFASPIRVEAKDGRWINIFDRDDPFAYPLKALNNAYHQAVALDAEVDTGFFGVAHVKYWKNVQTHRLIAEQLIKNSG